MSWWIQGKLSLSGQISPRALLGKRLSQVRKVGAIDSVDFGMIKCTYNAHLYYLI